MGYKKIKLPKVVGGFSALVRNMDGKSTEIEIAYKNNQGKKERIPLKSGQSKQMPSGIPYRVRYVGSMTEGNGSNYSKPKYDPYNKK